jgi:NADH-quinone oxidoreductase subunit F
MVPQLDSALEKLSSDIRSDARNLPLLFWLRAYTTIALERGAPRVRWTKLSGFVSRTAGAAGINGLDHAPGHALVTSYGLFQAVGLDDGGVARGREPLLNLDWHRGYEIELVPEWQNDLAEVGRWADGAWEELRRAERTDGALASILTRWAPEGRSGLLPALIEAQEAHGWLSKDVLTQIAQGLRVPLSEVYGVTTYYKMLYTQPVGRRIVRVCDDVRCYLGGSQDQLKSFEKELGAVEGQNSKDGNYTLEAVPCLGHCDCGPVVQVGDSVHEKVSTTAIRQILDMAAADSGGIAEGPVLLKDIGDPSLRTLEGYIAHGGFVALRKALTEMTPEQITAEIKASGLVGRGGAAFPTGLKWELTAKAIKRLEERGGHMTGRSWGYVVCNADESETGTFKDRIMLERNPFRVLEGILLCARAIGATYGYIYIRGEYALAYSRLKSSLEQARAKGYLGAHILGTELSFDLEIRRGAGAYECGEETALFESIEGKRGEPRVKPPFPVDVGLFSQPTVINNVETLANTPYIVEHGASAYRKFGTEKSPGTRLVCLSGQVRREGLYEISMGTSLRQVIFEMGGGLNEGRRLETVLVGGAAGAFLSPDQIDVPLAFESLNSIGATFGSGAIIVIDDSADMWQVLKRIARFFKDESCGKCFPCQLGTQRQLELVERMAVGGAREGDRALLFEVGQVMKDASLCGLGQFAANAIMSAFEKKLVGV